MKKKVLIIYYSFTQQTRVLLKKFAEGLEEKGVEVAFEKLVPEEPFNFPFKSDVTLFKAMVQTFFRKRMAIKPVSERCQESWDCIVLAGPTWSYHPSGPILDFLDTFGDQVCGGKHVLPFISCRSYWRFHVWSLRRMLIGHGATVAEPQVFVHPIKEPFRFIGLVLQLRGKMVRREKSWFRKHYPGYGHNKQQGVEAKEAGITLGVALNKQ